MSGRGGRGGRGGKGGGGSGGIANVKKWVIEQTRKLAKKAMGDVPEGFVEGSVVPTILSIYDEEELSQYVRKTFADAPSPAVEGFLNNLLQKKRGDPDGVVFAQPPPDGQIMQMIVSKKQQYAPESEIVAKNKAKSGPKKKSGGGRKGGANAVVEDYSSVPSGTVVFNPEKEGQGFVRRVSSDRYCGCFGTRHTPLTNCLNCGKVACSEEGYGPCTYCGSMVTPLKSRQQKGSKGSAVALMSMSPDASEKEKSDAEKAMKLKNHLIEFDRTSAQRTVIYDDQEDYYSTSEWLSPEERARQQQEAQRLQDEKQLAKEDERKAHIAFGFAGRTVSVVSGKEATAVKRAAIIASQKPDEKGLGRVVQRKKDDKVDSAHHSGNVPVAPNVEVAPVYAVVKGKKGESAVALSKTDGSLDRFLESLRFQQIEDSYYQDDNKEDNKEDKDDEDDDDDDKTE